MEINKRRLFLAVPVSYEIANSFALQLEIFKGRQIPATNWHLTLHFLGDVEEERLHLLQTTFQNLSLGSPFTLIFDHLGAFPKPTRAHTLWIGAQEGTSQANELALLTRKALLSLNYSLETRPFIPHITVQRFSRAQNIKMIIETFIMEPINVNVDQVILYESILGNGHPQYKEIETYKLKN